MLLALYSREGYAALMTGTLPMTATKTTQTNRALSAVINLAGLPHAYGTASAESVFSGEVAANAFDGNGATAWGSLSHDTWLKMDFGVPINIGAFHVLQAAFDGQHGMIVYDVQSSDDDAIWTTRYTVTTLVADSPVYRFPSVTARYWRINSLAANRENPGSGTEVYTWDLYQGSGYLTKQPGKALPSSLPFGAPAIRGLETSTVMTAGTAHNVRMPPEVVSGDLLVVLISLDAGNITSVPSGWTLRSTVSTLNFLTKTSDGTEANQTLNFSTSPASVEAVATTFTIKNVASFTQTIITGTSTAPDSPSVSSGNANASNLVVSAYTTRGTATILSSPAGYGQTTYAINPNTLNGGITVGTARASVVAATANPGALDRKSVV